MSEAVQLALIQNMGGLILQFATLVTAVAGLIAVIKGVRKIRHHVNGHTTKVIDAVEKIGHAEGKIDMAMAMMKPGKTTVIVGRRKGDRTNKPIRRVRR